MAAAAEAVTSEIAGRSLRDELLAAQAEVMEREDAPEEKETAITPEPATDDRPRGADGKFVAKEAAELTEETVKEPEKTEPPKQQAAPDFVPAPQSWTNQDKALWDKVPQDVRQVILKREQEVHKAITQQDEDRSLARQFKQLADPYQAMFNSVGASPLQGFQDYLRIAYTLNTGAPEMKAQVLQQIAQRYGVNLGQQTPQEGAQAPPQYLQRLSQLEAMLQEQLRNQQALQQQQQQAEMSKTMADIDAFSRDPAHKHFEYVRDHMATLLNSGAAQSLQDAYDQACWARPDIRTQLIAEQTATQRKEQESRQKTDKARAKAVSVRGGTGAMPETAAPNRTLREELSAAFEEARGRI